MYKLSSNYNNEESVTTIAVFDKESFDILEATLDMMASLLKVPLLLVGKF